MTLPVLALALVLTGATPTTVAETKPPHIDALAVPLLSFNSDLGVGYGAAGGMIVYAPGYAPYRYAISAQTFFTAKGFQSHYVHFDGPRLIGPVRIEGQLEYKRDLFAPFFGPGNDSAPGVLGAKSSPLYSYDRHAPAGWARARWRFLGQEIPLDLSFGYLYRYNQVRPYEQSLLAELRPHGIEGGSQGEVLLQASWDTRDTEANPRAGSFYEVSVRSAGGATGSREAFTGLTLSGRKFFPLGRRFVLGQRVVVDALFGNVPFFEWTTIGASSPLEGVGGMGTVRGVPRARYGGNTKALSNTELRCDFFGFPLFHQQTTVGAVGLLDLGRVWHPGVDDGPWYRWHPGLGLGLRASRRAAVARVDYALSTETGRQGIYVTFGQMF